MGLSLCCAAHGVHHEWRVIALGKQTVLVGALADDVCARFIEPTMLQADIIIPRARENATAQSVVVHAIMHMIRHRDAQK